MAISSLLKQALKRNFGAADEAGFDISTMWFHGGKKGAIEEIDPSKFGSVTGTPPSQRAFFLVDNPDTAAGFAKNAGGGEVHEFLYRPQGTATVHWDDLFPGLSLRSNNGQRALASILDDAKEQGIPGLLIKGADDTAVDGGKSGNVLAVLDPSRLRYPEAAFKDISSRNTLATAAPLVVGAGALTALNSEKAQASEMTPKQQEIIKRAEERLGMPAEATLTETQMAVLRQARQRMVDAERPAVTGGRGIFGQTTQQRQFDEEQAAKIDEGLKSGEIQSSELSPEQISAVQKHRVSQIPEIAGQFKNLSENLGFAQAVAGMTAFDPDEFGQILQEADPNIGIVTTPDGERIAVNNETGARFSINKVGPSLTDAFQLGGAFAAFSPAGAARKLAGQAIGGMGTQALIEAGQSAAGGEFNPEDVALAGAAPVVIGKGTQLAKSGIRRLKGRSSGAVQYVDDHLQGIEPKPSTLEAQAGTQVPAGTVELPIRETAKKGQIRQALKEGTKEAAGWKLNPRGQVVPDAVARETVKQGFDPRTVATIKVGSDADRQSMLKMLDLAEESLKSGTARVRNRPQQVIGDTIMERFRVIKRANADAGKEIGKVADEQLKGKVVDITNVVDDFADDMDRLGVQIGDDGFNFKGSQIEGNKATTVIRRVSERLKDSDDGGNLHRLKQYIDSQIDWEKSPDKPLDKQAVNALKKLRNGINERLKEESADYAAANARFSETIDAINDLYDVMGRRFDPSSDRVTDLVGQEMRKVLSNYGIRNDMILAVDKLDEVARKYGGQFTDDPLHQVVFYSDLERVLGTFADNSLQGVQEKAIGVGLDAVSGSAAGTGIRLIKAGVGKALGKSEEKAIRSMRTLLSQ